MMWAFFGLAVARMKIYGSKQFTTQIETDKVTDSLKRYVFVMTFERTII